jgi:hypothetical protein
VKEESEQAEETEPAENSHPAEEEEADKFNLYISDHHMEEPVHVSAE